MPAMRRVRCLLFEDFDKSPVFRGKLNARRKSNLTPRTAMFVQSHVTQSHIYSILQYTNKT